jgi:hypothetical protein
LPCHQAELKDPECPESQNDDRPQDHGEEQRYRKGKVTLKKEEVHFDGLEVLQNEDEDHHQNDYADDERCPRSTQPGLALTRQGLPGLGILVCGIRHFANRKRVLGALNIDPAQARCSDHGLELEMNLTLHGV